MEKSQPKMKKKRKKQRVSTNYFLFAKMVKWEKITMVKKKGYEKKTGAHEVKGKKDTTQRIVRIVYFE